MLKMGRVELQEDDSPAPDEPWHGSARGYRYYGCRKECCRKAKALEQRIERARARQRSDSTVPEKWATNELILTQFNSCPSYDEIFTDQWAKIVRSIRRGEF
jgi:hypothetical protein